MLSFISVHRFKGNLRLILYADSFIPSLRDLSFARICSNLQQIGWISNLTPTKSHYTHFLVSLITYDSINSA